MLRPFLLMSYLLMPSSLLPYPSVKAVIFDCDGTLVDSEETHLAAWRRALQNRGHDLTLEECLLYTGKSDSVIAELIAAKIGYQEASGEILAEKRVYYGELLEQGLPSIDATIQFANRLIQEKEKLGLKLAVASAAIKHEITTHLKALGLENAFELVLSGHEDLHVHYEDPEGVNKPKPYIYLHAAKLLGISPSECIVIEDSQTGVTAAARAGCLVVAIPNAASRSHDFSNALLILETLAGYSVTDFLEVVCQKARETAADFP